MSWGQKHPIETAIEFAGPSLLAGAVGWSGWTIGLSPTIVGAAAAIAFVIGALIIGMAGRGAEAAIAGFEPVPFVDEGADELLLDNPLIETDELLLDDPLTGIADNSRVVRLFARQEPTPGELVARIEDFLGDGGGRAAPRPAAGTSPPDASAALHAALANIRSSLK